MSKRDNRGRRLIICTRPDCAHSGDAVPDAIATEIVAAGLAAPSFWCLAEDVAMVRTDESGLPCYKFEPMRAATLDARRSRQ